MSGFRLCVYFDRSCHPVLSKVKVKYLQHCFVARHKRNKPSLRGGTTKQSKLLRDCRAPFHCARNDKDTILVPAPRKAQRDCIGLQSEVVILCLSKVR